MTENNNLIAISEEKQLEENENKIEDLQSAAATNEKTLEKVNKKRKLSQDMSFSTDNGFIKVEEEEKEGKENKDMQDEENNDKDINSYETTFQPTLLDIEKEDPNVEITHIIENNVHFIPLYIKMFDRRLKTINEENLQLKSQVESLTNLLMVKDDIGNEEEALKTQLDLERENNEETSKKSLKLITQYKSQIETLTNLVSTLNKDLKSRESLKSSSASKSINRGEMLNSTANIKTTNSTLGSSATSTTFKEVPIIKKPTTNQQTNQSIKSVQKPQQVSIPLSNQKTAQQPPLLPKKSETVSKNYRSQNIPLKTSKIETIKKN